MNKDPFQQKPTHKSVKASQDLTYLEQKFCKNCIGRSSIAFYRIYPKVKERYKDLVEDKAGIS
ncbi:MAG: hypothetical protein AB1297_06115, partial [bacterium]